MHCLVVTFDKYWVFHVFLFVDAKKRGRDVILKPYHLASSSYMWYFEANALNWYFYWRSFLFLSDKIEWMVPVLRVSYIFCGWIQNHQIVLFLEYLPTVMKGFPCGYLGQFHRHNNPSKLNSSKRTFFLSVFRLTWYIREFKQ